MKKGEKYDWDVGKAPPKLDQHSLAKHNVLREYLQLYVEVLTNNKRSDHLTLSLVDGFCGGGAFIGPSGETCLGSPLIMQEAMAAASALANTSRLKPFNLDVEYFFVDFNKTACDHLKHVVGNSEYKNTNYNIINKRFDGTLDRIINRIKTRGTAHRCIFVLDQYGYSQVTMGTLRKIFKQLPNAEVILTFATDCLIRYLSTKDASRSMLRNIGFDLSVDAIEEAKATEPLSWRKAVQHLLHQQVYEKSAAKFYTPFFIHSPKSNGSYWLIHLSNHHRARDVMMNLHWQHGNDFRHYGESGLQMFGYNWKYDPQITSQDLLSDDFKFDENARLANHKSLMEDLPQRLANNGQDKLPFGTLFSSFTNETPSTSSMVGEAFADLTKEGLVEVTSQKTGKLRKPGSKIHNSDLISLSPQKLITYPAL